MLFDLLFVTIYWASFWLVGLALVPRFNANWVTWKKLSDEPAWRHLTYFAAGLMAFGLLTLVTGLLNLPFWVLFAGTIGLQLWAIYTVLKQRLLRQALPPSHKFSPASWVMLFWLLFLGVGALWLGGNFGYEDDVWVHLSRSRLITYEGVGFNDAFFKGAFESRYHLNVIHSAMAVGSKLPRVSLLEFWQYSLVTFVALKALATFALVRFLVKNPRLQLFALAVSPAFITRLFYASYPNVVAQSWLIWLFIAGVVLWERRQTITRADTWWFAGGALLIGLTHPTYALISASLLLFLGFICLLNRQLRKEWQKPVRATLIALPLLLWAPILGLLAPNYMPASSAAVGEGSLFRVMNLFGTDLQILDPRFGLTPLITLFSLLGLVYLLFQPASRERRLGVIAGLTIFPLIAFNPIGLEIARQLAPLWWIVNFRAADVAWPIYGMVGVAIIAATALSSLKLSKVGLKRAEVLFALFLILLTLGVGARYNREELATVKASNTTWQQYATALEELDGTISNDQPFVIAERTVSYMTPAVLGAEVLYITPDHATPTVKFDGREACRDAALSNNQQIRQQAWQELKPDYIILANDRIPGFRADDTRILQQTAVFTVVKPVYPAKQTAKNPSICAKVLHP